MGHLLREILSLLVLQHGFSYNDWVTNSFIVKALQVWSDVRALHSDALEVSL